MDYLSVRAMDNGRWVEVNDHLKYVVEASSFADIQQSHRRQTVESPWIGGRFLVNIVPDQVEESLSVYVYGTDQVDLDDNIGKLIETFTQFSFILEVATDQSRKQYSCECADYSVNKSRELLHNNMALVSFRIPRIPEYDRIVDY